jgi:hypothetical protein
VELRIWAITVFALLALVLAMWAAERLIWAAGRSMRAENPRGKVSRRATAGAAFALQQIFEPGTEHVVRAEHDQPSDDDDSAGEGDRATPVDTLLADLRARLAESPIDSEAVRRVLVTAERDGHDPRALFEAAVRDELAARPYRVPLIPPWSRVAPRGIG